MIEWKYVKKNVSNADIKEFENIFGFSFPENLRDFILMHNNGRPKPNGFDTKKSKGRVFDKLLSFNKSDKENVFSTYSLLKNDVPENLVVIAADPFGNFICADKANGFRVSLWLHENESIEETGKTIFEIVDSLY